MSANPQTLLAEANCLMCKLTPGMVPYAILAAAIGVANSGAGGGVDYGTVDPTTAPLGDSGWYYNTTSSDLWVWNPATATWDKVVD